MKLPVLVERPKTRGQCVRGLRPCPFVGCRHHMLDVVVDDDGNLEVGDHRIAANADPATVERTIERIATDLVRRGESCSLDLAERNPDGVTLDEVAAPLRRTRERMRQIVDRALPKLRPPVVRDELRLDRPGPAGRSRTE